MPDATEIAKAEMVRRRRRLGELTPNQEIAIENLLMSTVNRISELVGRALEAEPRGSVNSRGSLLWPELNVKCNQSVEQKPTKPWARVIKT